MYAILVANLRTDERSDLILSDPDPDIEDKFVPFTHRSLLCQGVHGKPCDFETLVRRWPSALILAMLLLVGFVWPHTAGAQQLLTVRDTATGRMRVVQVFAPTGAVSEPPRRSVAFDRYWTDLPTVPRISRIAPVAPSTNWTAPAPGRQGWLVNPYR